MYRVVIVMHGRKLLLHPVDVCEVTFIHFKRRYREKQLCGSKLPLEREGRIHRGLI